ncbi:MAG: peptidylprolyl isomerase [Acidobacteria bacterium]|nr:peptidylprolyl isomerase [Acidobacteriota bacterium]
MNRLRMSKPARSRGLLIACALSLALAAGPAAAREGKAAPESPVQVTVERLGNFCYAGEPVLVRVAIFNTGKTAYDNSKGIALLGNVTVLDAAGSGLKKKSAAAPDARQQPAFIPAGGFFGVIADLRDAVDGLDRPGQYVARFQSADLSSDPVPLVVIPKFDPHVRYRATIETDFGSLALDLFGKEAPEHVHNFYDLANQGYYDGTLFHVIVKGIEVRGGDRSGSGDTSPGYSLKPEIDKALKHKRGSLSMLRGETSDHGSQFMISLAESPKLDGQMTIFGMLAGGDDALGALESLPTSGQRSFPFFRPLKDAKIHTLRVAPAPAGAMATAEADSVTTPSKP